MTSVPPPGLARGEQPARRKAGSAHITAPDGAQWRVRRRWVTARVRPSWRGRSVDDLAILDGGGWGDFDVESLLIGIVALVVIVFVVIPLLLFGLELVIAGVVIAGSIIGRLLLGRPWQIEATTVNAPGAPRICEWEVSGWRRSRAMINAISEDIAAGRDPQPSAVRLAR